MEEGWEQTQARDLKILNEQVDQFNAEAEGRLTYQTSDN